MKKSSYQLVNKGKFLMKTIGLIGGMSWESTETYYQIINETIKEQCGGLHSRSIKSRICTYH